MKRFLTLFSFLYFAAQSSFAITVHPGSILKGSIQTSNEVDLFPLSGVIQGGIDITLLTYDFKGKIKIYESGQKMSLGEYTSTFNNGKTIEIKGLSLKQSESYQIESWQRFMDAANALQEQIERQN